jgi:hypothetical protein
LLTRVFQPTLVYLLRRPLGLLDERSAPATLDAIRDRLAQFDVTKFYCLRGFALSLLGESQSLGGSINDAIVTVERALQANPDELWHHPLTLRLLGELRLRSATDGAKRFELAEQDFRESVDMNGCINHNTNP